MGIYNPPPVDVIRLRGADPTGVADSTAAIQAWLTLCGAGTNGTTGTNPTRGMAPPGRYKVTTVSITRPMNLDMEGVFFEQVISDANPALTIRVAHTGTNYYTSLGIPAIVRIRGLRITGGDAASGDTGQHGIDIQNAGANPVATKVILDDIIVTRMAGSGINGASFTGWVEGDAVVSSYNTLYGCNANTCSDWRFKNSYFHSNTLSGLLMSGCTEFAFTACNYWSNLLSGIHFFDTADTGEHKFVGCQIDRNTQHGVNADIRAAGNLVTFVGCTFVLNSQSGDSAFSEINLTVNSLGKLVFSGCIFGRTFPQATVGTENSQYHFLFAGTGEVHVDAATQFKGGYMMTSAPAQVVQAGRTTIVTDATTARTLILADAQKLLKMTSGSANNITVPANSTAAFPIGTTIHAVMYGAGQTAFVAAGGVTINPAGTLKIDGQYTEVTITKIGTDEWLLVGKIKA